MIQALLPDVLAGLAAGLLWLALGWLSYLIALRLTGKAAVAVRLCAAAATAFWLMTALFWLLVPLHLFRLSVVLPLVLVLAVAGDRLLDRGDRGDRLARGSGAAARLADDVRAATGFVARMMRTPAGVSLVAVFAVAAVRLARGSAAPPLGWDALTYHLYKAGRWVQLGGLASQPAPDAWRSYEYFPVVGDVYWAWAMLPLRSDALLTAAGAAIWLTGLLGVYALARESGARAEHAVYAAAAVGAMPATLGYLSSAYVDNTTMVLFVLGMLFALRVARRRLVAEAPLAIGALALMLGTKLTTAAYFLVGALFVGYGIVRASAPWRLRRIAALGCLLAAVAGAPSYQRAWVERGSPFYPFHIAFGTLVLSQGNTGAADAVEMLESRYRLQSAWSFWEYFLGKQTTGGSFLNPGPGVLVLALLALLGTAELVRRRRWLAAILASSCALLTLLGFLSGNMEAFRTTIKVTTAGRYLLPGLAALAVLASAWPRRAARFLWVPGIAAGLFLAFPRGWVPVERVPVAGVALLLLLLGGAVAWALHRALAGGRGPVVAAVALVVSIGLFAAALEQVRAPYRYRLWAAASQPAEPYFHMHGLLPIYAAAWPIWEALDEPGEEHRIDAVAGWDGLGHNWYRYPLLGSRLQNRVLYVPITASGAIVDYRLGDEVAKRADLHAWIARLLAARVEYVVSLAPRSTIEDYWMRTTPELFDEVMESRGHLHAAFRFRRDAARAALDTIPASPP